jgi:uncharacterized protein
MTKTFQAKTFAFLTAQWSNLALLSYSVPSETLVDLTPPDCELDLLDGKAFVSLVAFDFTRTRVFGVGWPGMRNFPEVNLRFYVRHGDRRGVCFVREFVPSRAIALVARLFYNEPYLSVPMTSETNESAESVTVRHSLEIGGQRQTLSIVGNKPAHRPGSETTEHFFKEHNWGYGVSSSGQLIHYRVDHPSWDVYPIQSWDSEWDWQAVYGPRWAFLQNCQPDHVMLAAGSAVRVSRRK